MRKRRKFKPIERLIVYNRANGCCEYCKIPSDYSNDTYTLEHTLDFSKGGSDDLRNIAYACGTCNANKRDYSTAFDSVTNSQVPIYNPREQNWGEHFVWSDDFCSIIVTTAIGRATVDLLKLNSKALRNLRKALIAIDVHPIEK